MRIDLGHVAVKQKLSNGNCGHSVSVAPEDAGVGNEDQGDDTVWGKDTRKVGQKEMGKNKQSEEGEQQWHI